MPNYVLTFRVRFSALEDVSARSEAYSVLSAMGLTEGSGDPAANNGTRLCLLEGESAKLQRILPNHTPMKVSL